MKSIGIRREDKSKWERRAPLIPEDIKKLIEKEGVKFIVQPSPVRVFPEQNFKDAGAEINESLKEADIILGIKEIPPYALMPYKTYIFFSHTIKGQSYNMPMLKKLMELKCTLIDYEKIVDDKGRRLIFFGKYAGFAGMIDTLWTLGQRLVYEKVEPNPFKNIKQSFKYATLNDAIADIKQAGGEIEQNGLPESLKPFVVGFAGYGNVSLGAQSILDNLPVKEITPQELDDLSKRSDISNKVVYKVVFKEQDMVEPIDSNTKFELQDYYASPQKYKGIFAKYLTKLTLLVNCIFWNKQYPRLITLDDLKNLWKKNNNPNYLKVIGDISCDIDGAIEATVKATEPDDPVFVYEPLIGKIKDGVEGSGPVILAVDILPTELPVEASQEFSSVLSKFIHGLTTADYSVNFDALNLAPELKKAVIVYHGELTKDYTYLEKFLKQ